MGGTNGSTPAPHAGAAAERASVPVVTPRSGGSQRQRTASRSTTPPPRFPGDAQASRPASERGGAATVCRHASHDAVRALRRSTTRVSRTVACATVCHLTNDGACCGVTTGVSAHRWELALTGAAHRLWQDDSIPVRSTPAGAYQPGTAESGSPYKRQAVLELVNALWTRLASVATLVDVDPQHYGPLTHV